MFKDFQNIGFINKKLSPQVNFIGEKIKALVKKQDKEAQVLLFGSRARGDSENESDWDILVLTDKNSDELNNLLIKEFLYQIEMPYHVVISAIVKNKHEWYDHYAVTPLFDSIQKEGILL
jgi:predicted nucleotidyltransferase